LNSELLIETNHEVLKHLQGCASCSDELEARAEIKRLLKRAVQSERAPIAMREKIQREIRRSRPEAFPPPARRRLALAASIVIALLLGTWGVLKSRPPNGGPAQGSEQARTNQMSETMNGLDVGLDEHAYCALHWRFSKEPPTPGQVAETMGTDYAALALLVKEKMPEGYKLAEAHRCRHNGREFNHFILTSGPSIISLIITGKIGDDSLTTDAAADWQVAGVLIYRAHARDQEVAGFETGRHLVFVVSGLDKKDNMQIASSLAPSVHDFVIKFES